MPHSLTLFIQGGNTWSSMFLAQMLVNISPVLYALAIRVVYGFGIRLRGMCKVTPYMETTTACCGISVIYHTLQCYITYIPQRGALIFTSSVVHISLTFQDLCNMWKCYICVFRLWSASHALKFRVVKSQCRDFPQSYVVIPLAIGTRNLFHNLDPY